MIAVKNYYFTLHHSLSTAQLDSIVSSVLIDLKEEDLTVLDKHPDIYCPVQAISERSQLRWAFFSSSFATTEDVTAMR